MKKLTNKKGFTLIEMLVVIAIIAILVAIIIPVVSSATDKAAAATNAANLRSIKAEATTELISGVANEDGYVKLAVTTGTDGTKTYTLTPNTNAPKSKKCGNCAADQVASITVTNNVVDVKYGSYGIDQFAAAAESGSLS